MTCRVARATAETPPRPIALLSAAATRRRERSSRTPCTAVNRRVIPVRSVILSRIRQNISIWKCCFVTSPKGRFNTDSLDDLAFYYPSDGSLWMGLNRVSDFKKIVLAGHITPRNGWTLIAGDRFRPDTNALDDILLYRPDTGGLVVGEVSGSSFFLTGYGSLYNRLSSSSIAVTHNRPLADLFTFMGELYFQFHFHANRSRFSSSHSVDPRVGASERRLTGGYKNFLLAYNPQTGRVEFGRLILPPWIWN